MGRTSIGIVLMHEMGATEMGNGMMGDGREEEEEQSWLGVNGKVTNMVWLVKCILPHFFTSPPPPRPRSVSFAMGYGKNFEADISLLRSNWADPLSM